MRWSCAQPFTWPGLGPAQMLCPLASADGTVLTCQNVLRNTVKSLLRILKVGGRQHTIPPMEESFHITWVGMRKCYLASWTASKHTVIGPQNPEPRLELGPRTQSKQYKQRLKTLRSSSTSSSGGPKVLRPENKEGLTTARGTQIRGLCRRGSLGSILHCW